MKDSLAVIPVKGKVLKFVAWIDHPDSDVKPVHTRVWADSKLVYEGELQTHAAVSRHSRDAGQDAHGASRRRSIAPAGPAIPETAATIAISGYRSATGSGNREISDLRSQIADLFLDCLIEVRANCVVGVLLQPRVDDAGVRSASCLVRSRIGV